ncbi:MAG: ABC-F family ATP-binding cassette domain-containing protein [Bacteroidales bacterium]|nr:ABC-F family ATP-binding cassette domain-containing protein [Bacteroidales bacterium]
MASYLQIENISKSYGDKILFEKIGFNINEGDKIALIAPNGTGKTTLMRILAGKDKSDSGGQIKFLKQIRIAFLEQDYAFDPQLSAYDQVWRDSAMQTAGLDDDGLFAYELRIRQLMTALGLGDGSQPMSSLSGGEVKRVALTRMLATEADFYIMDEPTNHLDTDAIEFLESYFKKARCTLFMVTHDRYFLDRVCNTVMEMDHGAIYIYRGDYENYLVKRQERIDNYNAQTDKVRNILRRELEWMHATPCARSGKAKYRKDAFYELKDRAEQVYRSSRVDMGDVGAASRLGSKIIDCKDVSFWYGDACYLSHFTYNFQRYERVGIVGRNGVGKSTFINLLTGSDSGGGRLSGIIERGESLRIGYYHQDGIRFDEDQTVLETVSDTHLLSTFLFPHEMLANRIASLSGGEKRRLYLLTILMRQPNLLILDEPTNDLDIVTLNVLEEYLLSFKGTLIIVSHDRHFLDRLVDHLFVFCGDGVVKDFIGGYTEYRSYIKDYEAEQKRLREEVQKTVHPAAVSRDDPPARKKLSWKEQREFEALEAELDTLNAEKAEIEALLSGGSLSYEACNEASRRYSELKALIDEKEMRWLELSLI